MRIPLRAAFRLAVTGCLGLAGLSIVVAQGQGRDPEKMLPDSTLFFVKVKNAAALRESFEPDQLRPALADPA